MKQKELHIFRSPEDLANKFANQLMNWLEGHAGETFHFAISGGKTPDLLFSALADKYPDSPLWQKVHFWWVDERMVSPDDPESNFGIANRLLLSKISIPEGNIHRIHGENDPGQEALSYSKQIQEKLPFENNWPAFDLILLGMGNDGHTASIFPDQMELLTTENICEVAVFQSTKQKRITLTGQVINNARKVCFLVTGESKASRIDEILSDHVSAGLLPAYHIHPSNNDLSWYMDESAAKYIR